jgi:predicted aldo/keto reductase-like oxidoreductase
MDYHPLGQTGIQVSAIGLGGEHLLRASRETVVEIIHAALDRGVNYFDIIWAHPEYRDNFAAALQGRREQVVLPGHLGSTLKGTQYQRARSAGVCERYYQDLLTRLGTDYLDVAMIHNLNGIKDYEALLGPNGVVELAHRLKREGRARAVGMSGHSVELFNRVLQDGVVDLLMLPVNMAGNAQPGRKQLLQACAARGVGVVAMKAYAGGKLFQQRRTVYFAHYQTGGGNFKRKVPPAITPVQCLAYALAQPAVATVIPGVASMAELEAAVAYTTATDEERDFSAALAGFQEYVGGECVYCNHCLPCPAEIDIGLVSRLVDVAGDRPAAAVRAEYAALPARAAACTACGACEKRCPFDVAVIARMERAVALFGS